MEDDPAKLIPEEELGRLIRILGMLGSAHEGERAAAALKAAEWVREHQTDWQTLLLPPLVANPVVSVGVGPAEAPQRPVQPAGPWVGGFTAAARQAAQQATQAYAQAAMNQQAQPAPFTNFNMNGTTPVGMQPSWQTAAMAVLIHFPSVLRGGKESDFVQSLLSRGWPKLTDKQAVWLADICSRAGISW